MSSTACTFQWPWWQYLPLYLICYWCRSVTQSRLTLCSCMDCSTPGLPVPHHLLEFVPVDAHCISDAVQPSHLLTPSSQSFPVSGTFPVSYLFTSDDQKYWSFSFSISPFSEYSGLISLKIDWFDLAVQGTFRSLLQCPYPNP